MSEGGVRLNDELHLLPVSVLTHFPQSNLAVHLFNPELIPNTHTSSMKGSSISYHVDPYTMAKCGKILCILK